MMGGETQLEYIGLETTCNPFLCIDHTLYSLLTSSIRVGWSEGSP